MTEPIIPEEPVASTFVSPTQQRLQAVAEGQVGFVEDLKLGGRMTSAYAGMRRAGQEGNAALQEYNEANPLDRATPSVDGVQTGRQGLTFGQLGATLGGIGRGLIGSSHDSGEEFDKREHVEELIKDIPGEALHREIMDEPTLEAAMRARARIVADLEDKQVAALQYEGGGASLAGSVLDVDIALMLASGGMFGAAKAARLARIATKNKHATGAVQGISGGAQAGLMVGAYDMIVRETSDEAMLVTSVIGGAGLGGIMGSLGGDMTRSLDVLQKDHLDRFAKDDPTITATDDTTLTNTPTEPLLGPVLIDMETGAASVPAPQRIPIKREGTDHFEPAAAEYTASLKAEMGTPAFPTVKLQGHASKNPRQLAKADKNTKAILASESFEDVAGLLQAQGLTDLKNVGSGRTKVVLQQGDEVVRVMLASDKPTHSKYPRYLTPTYAGKIGDLYVEVMPSVKMDLTAAEVIKFDKLVQKEGYKWVDANFDNLGRGADGKIYIIDGEVFPVGKVGTSSPQGKRAQTGRGIWTGIEDLVSTPKELSEWTRDGFTAGSAGAAQRIPAHVRQQYADAVAAGASDAELRRIANAPSPTRSTTLVDPVDRLSPTSTKIIDMADELLELNGFRERKAEEKNWIEKLSLSKWMTAVGSGFHNKMYNSNSVVMNWMGSHIYESASGLNRGESTAGGLSEKYHKLIQGHLLPVRSHMTTWAQANGVTIFGLGHGTSDAGKAAFYREVMLERNARQFGRTHSTDLDIKGASDAFDNAAVEALKIAKGRDDQIAIRGMQDVLDNPHYSPQPWNGAKMRKMIRDNHTTRANIVAAVASGYRQAGMAAWKDADAVASAVVRRAELNDANVDSSVQSLLQADGQEFLRDALEQDGVAPQAIEGIMKRLVGDAADRSKPGFAKSRNEIDLSAPITMNAGVDSQLQLVDLLSHDLAGDWQRYTRQVSGSAALARHGIDSMAARKEVVSAIHAEQRALGEEMTPANEIMAMFTYFDGGATKGYSALNGGDPAAAGAAVAAVKRMVQLAWLNKLGLVQLGETNSMIAQNGMASWVRRGPFARFDATLKAANKEVLREVEFMTGRIGKDHTLFSDHLNLDEVSNLDAGDLMSRFNKATSSAAYVQGFTSLFNHVRSSQQKTAALGVMDKVMRTLRDAQEPIGPGSNRTSARLSDEVLARMWGDLGLSHATLMRLDDLIGDGKIEFDPRGFVQRLNVDQWDPDLKDIVGVSIIRNINQVVQKSMAGEEDAWMHTALGSLLTHLKTFPMQATQKQMVRHFRHNDPQAYSALVWGFGTALAASLIRGAVDGKDMTAEEHAKRAFGYSNMTGFLPMAYDPLMTMIGADDMRFNQYGKHSEVAVPALAWVNDAMRLPGAIGKSVAGEADYDDMRAKRTLPFANTMLLGDMLLGIGQK